MTRIRFAALLTASALTCMAGGALAQSQPSFPAPPPAERPDNRPNVLIWLLDDVGFAHFSSYGGIVETPNIDRVASMGLQFANYHTAPICSASRAALLTGRNPHSVEMGGHALLPFPTPGYRGKIPADAGTVAANLKAAGYATLALGKWDHLQTSQISPIGPFTYWPSGQGFDRFYGFLAADANQWQPALVRDNSPIATPVTTDYHLSADLAEQAIAMIDESGSGAVKHPFFMYWATGIAHAPHHAPKEWIERYRGKFDMGWDKARADILRRQIKMGLVPASTKLAPRPDGMPAWDSLSPDQKKIYTRQMEVFAASLSYTDAQFGRILAKLEQSGQLDNTIIIITSDNGASAEGAENGTYNEDLLLNAKHQSVEENIKFHDSWGGPATFPHYALGWAVAGNTPLRYYKQIAHGGGTHVPMIMAWPNGVSARGEKRDQYVYVTDIAPTVLELAGVPMAGTINNVVQRPFEGVSFSYAINDAKAKDKKQAQYIELFGNKSLWSDGWTIVTSHRLRTWEGSMVAPITEPWELYDVRKDPGQTNNLAAQNPIKVAELSELYDEQAEQYNVTSVNIGTAPPFQMQRKRAEFAARQGVWSYSGPISLMSEDVAPPIQLMPFKATIQFDLATGTETGPLFALGGALGGMGLYLKDGTPRFTMRGFDGSTTTVSGSQPLTKGVNTLEITLDRPMAPPLTKQDIGITIKNNGHTLASEKASYAMPISFGISKTFDIGIDLGDPVSTEYPPSVPFEGNIGKSVFDFRPRN